MHVPTHTKPGFLGVPPQVRGSPRGKPFMCCHLHKLTKHTCNPVRLFRSTSLSWTVLHERACTRMHSIVPNKTAFNQHWLYSVLISHPKILSTLFLCRMSTLCELGAQRPEWTESAFCVRANWLRESTFFLTVTDLKSVYAFRAIFVSSLVFVKIIPLVHFNARHNVQNWCDVKSLNGLYFALTGCYWVIRQIACRWMSICFFLLSFFCSVTLIFHCLGSRNQVR